MEERWLPVVGYEGYYEVSDQGRVRSLDRTVTQANQWGTLTSYVVRGRVMKPVRMGANYRGVRLCRARTVKSVTVHRLVLSAFVGQGPEGSVTRHLNGDSTDNRLANLAYGTQSENAFDRVRHNTHNNASKTHCRHGHEFTPENTYINSSSGARCCRECGRRAARKYLARRKDQVQY